MKLTFALLSLLVVLTAVASTSGNGVLSGQVASVVDGSPVARAWVLIHPSGGGIEDVRITVERDGKFSAELPPGFYDVFVTAVGFAPTCSKVRLRAGQTTTYNPRIGVSKLESSQIASRVALM
ncbi:MAG TPA: carboxypeptidase-like regulatory domain-containing protein [Terriglobales bacterium]|nr:carboxypeptidase-like regulatory domain-containing protein [Terriglobales bacterium]